MRIRLAAAAALAVLTVSGCDINTGAPRTAKADCNCTPAPTAAPAPPQETARYAPPPHHRRHHRSYAYGGGYAWRSEYSEVSVETYDYRSDSRAYVTGGIGETGYGESGGGGAHGGWVDGYGRAHGDAGTAVHDRAAGRRRLDPWHGYDADCPDQAR